MVMLSTVYAADHSARGLLFTFAFLLAISLFPFAFSLSGSYWELETFIWGLCVGGGLMYGIICMVVHCKRKDKREREEEQFMVKKDSKCIKGTKVWNEPKDILLRKRETNEKNQYKEGGKEMTNCAESGATSERREEWKESKRVSVCLCGCVSDVVL